MFRHAPHQSTQEIREAQQSKNSPFPKPLLPTSTRRSVVMPDTPFDKGALKACRLASSRPKHVLTLMVSFSFRHCVWGTTKRRLLNTTNFLPRRELKIPCPPSRVSDPHGVLFFSPLCMGHHTQWRKE